MSTLRQCNTAGGDQCILAAMPAPRAPHFLAGKEGKIVDDSRDPELGSVFAAEMGRSCRCRPVDRHMISDGIPEAPAVANNRGAACATNHVALSQQVKTRFVKVSVIADSLALNWVRSIYRPFQTVGESTKPNLPISKRSAKTRTFALDYRNAQAYHRPQRTIFVLSPTDFPVSGSET